MLFYVTGAVFPFLADAQNRSARLEGDPLQFGMQCVFYAGAFWFIALNWRTVVRGLFHAKWIVGLTLVGVASTVWSQDPSFTLRRSVVLLATTVFGIYFGSRFTVSQQLKLLAANFALVVFCSFAIALLLPRYGVDHYLHPGHWQGAFTQKNMLARIMVLSATVFLFVSPGKRQWLRWVGVVGAVALLVLSRSVTGALVSCGIVGAIPLFKLIRAKATVAIPVAIAATLGCIGLAIVLSQSSGIVFEWLNRSPQLTGRTELWDAVALSIAEHPFLGYGFNAFWQGMTGASANVMVMVRWLPLHSHNGFLDLTLDLGLLGLVIFALGYFASWRRAIRFARVTPESTSLWFCCYLTFMFLYNLTESSILVENNICWVIYTSTVVSISFVTQTMSGTTCREKECAA